MAPLDIRDSAGGHHPYFPRPLEPHVVAASLTLETTQTAVALQKLAASAPQLEDPPREHHQKEDDDQDPGCDCDGPTSPGSPTKRAGEPGLVTHPVGKVRIDVRSCSSRLSRTSTPLAGCQPGRSGRRDRASAVSPEAR